MQLKVKKENIGQRLDKFLTGELPEFSRSQIQKIIKKKEINVNGKTATASHILKENDEIKINPRAFPREGAGINIKLSQTSPQTEKKREEKKDETIFNNIEIIADTPDYLVINKPAGLPAHRGKNHKKSGITLVDWILKKYPAIKKVGEDPNRPGIVHRLDKDVSGLMAIAKKTNFFDNLKKQFQKREVNKQYVALIYGNIQKDSDEINFPIERSRDGYKMAALPATVKGKPNPRGRKAVTEFMVLKRYINYSLLKVRIKTGRTHQIRVHLAAYDHPIAGDNLYGTAKTRLKNKKLNLGRVFLVACELSFTDLKGERKNFKIDLPENLHNFLKRLK